VTDPDSLTASLGKRISRKPFWKGLPLRLPFVKIRETGDEHLELHFDADRQRDAREMGAVGKKYY
jgi:hypothetical protein